MNDKQKILDIPKEGFCRAEQLAHALGISESLLWAWVKDGKIPEPHKIEGVRLSRWPVDVARKIIASQGGYTYRPMHQERQPMSAS